MALDLVPVMVELAGAVGEITGLPVYDAPPKKITQVPAVIVSYPSTIMYNAGGRGYDRLTVGVVVLVSRLVDAVSHTELGGFASSIGDESIKMRLEDKEDWTTIEGVSVQSGEFDVITIGGTEYLAVVVTAELVG